MKKRVPFLIAAIVLLLSVITVRDFLWSDSARLSIRPIAEISAPHLTVQGESMAQGKLEPLTIHTKNDVIILSASQKPDALTLRLIDDQKNTFYDLEFARDLSLKGFAPHTRLTVMANGKTLYSELPMDWNGRITLPLPADLPMELSFQQNDQDYFIRVLALTGGTV